ncbi:MAG: hypothetical protein GEU73_06255 [Chloroflexi bacterium]|nr:hypothetical protein [Chloroflexota bacterium]
MNFQTTRPFDRDYARLPEAVKDRVDKQLALLLANPRHPSLGFKRVRGTDGIWEVRITRSHRLTLELAEQTCILRRVGSHDILDQP